MSEQYNPIAAKKSSLTNPKDEMTPHFVKFRFTLTALSAVGKLQISNSFQRKETRFMFNSSSVLVSEQYYGRVSV
jgi:hypothetical protein